MIQTKAHAFVAMKFCVITTCSTQKKKWFILQKES